jgi:hypothetical protein
MLRQSPTSIRFEISISHHTEFPPINFTQAKFDLLKSDYTTS